MVTGQDRDPIFIQSAGGGTYTNMATTIAEISEDGTKAYSSKSQHG